MPDQVTLDVGIIGAGIAGLAAAIALRRAGHKTTIYERSSFKNEIGAAITLTPNANLIMSRWGFDARRAGETNKCWYRRMNAETLECSFFVDLTSVESDYGHHFSAFHRVDLHQQMREMAERAGAVIQLGVEIADVHCEEGELIFKDGTIVKRDLVIIADGVSNHFVEQVTGQSIPRQRTGKSVYRTLIPIEKLMADPLIRSMYEGKESGFCTTMAPKQGVFFITYPCSDEKIMNVAVFHKTREHQRDADDWNSKATVEDVLYQLQEGFHPAWKAIIKQADVVKCFTVGKRDTIPCMSRGKTVLIGDSAHPMQPTHAQGGAMGLEDAASLEVIFSDFDPVYSVEQRLELFNQLRLPRTNTTQLLSDAMFYQHESTDEMVERIRKYYKGPLLSLKTESWTKEIRDFYYPYDAFLEAKKALEYIGKEDGLPEGVVRHFGLDKD